jgi:hypothetical protein
VTQIRFSILAGRLAVCRLPPGGAIPSWALELQDFCSITRSSDELSVACRETQVPAEVKSEPGWVCFKLDRPFPFRKLEYWPAFLSRSPRPRRPSSLFPLSIPITFWSNKNLSKAPLPAFSVPDTHSSATMALRAAPYDGNSRDTSGSFPLPRSCSHGVDAVYTRIPTENCVTGWIPRYLCFNRQNHG